MRKKKSVESLFNQTQLQTESAAVDPRRVEQGNVSLTADISAIVEEDCVSDTVHIDQSHIAPPFSTMVTDNSRNWRFRADLSEQLILLLELYNPKDVYNYLRPLSLSLCADKASSVRWIAYRLVSEMIRKCYAASTPALAVDLISELVDKFCHSVKWSGRQAFVFVCQAVIEDDYIPIEQFAEHLMPHLLQLASDPVPNVRVLLARTLRQTLMENG